MSVMLSAASQQFGRYQVLEYLGSGGMSDVFVAMHTGLRRRVALKLMRTHLRADAGAVQRFLREGECAARVSHPNVVQVSDVGTEQGTPYLVMELLDGETLEQKLEREGPLPLESAVDLLLPILAAVAATHAAGVMHRDIKPGNILLARSSGGSLVPKLVDFGIATFTERRNITGSLGALGTPSYMSPEQARGHTLDYRSDLYSLASTLFELVTGQAPFGEGEVSEVLERVAVGRFPRAGDVMPRLPQAFDGVLARAAAYEPWLRYTSVSEFARALVPFASERTRTRWLAQQARSGGRESGVSGWFSDDEGHAAIGVQPTPLPRSSRTTISSAQQPYAARLLMAVALCALLAMLVTLRGPAQAAIVGTQPAHPSGAWSQAQPLVTRAPGVESARPLAARAQRLLALSPAHAEATLDQVSLGQGFVALPAFSDNAVHELRVSAKGHVTRVLLFRGALESTRIELEPIRRPERRKLAARR